VRLITKDLSDTLSSFHRRNAWIVGILACAHVGAVMFYLVALKENLIKPMLHGAKTLPAVRASMAGDDPGSVKAVVLLALCAGVVWFIVNRL
jgi:hypothetical protein